MCETSLISALWNSPNGYQSAATLIDIIFRYALPGLWLIWNGYMWVVGSGVLAGTSTYAYAADGVQRAHSSLEFAQKSWVLPEPVSARTVTTAKGSAATRKVAVTATATAATRAGANSSGSAFTGAGGLGLALPSTKAVHRDGRPVAGAKPVVTLPAPHKPQAHHNNHGSMAAVGGTGTGSGARGVGNNKRTNSGSTLPSVGSRANASNNRTAVGIIKPSDK